MNTKDNGVSKNTRKSTGASGSKDKPANDSMTESTVNINGEPVSVSLPSQAKNGQDGMNINLTINLAGKEKKKRAPRSSGTPQKKKTPKKKTEKKKKKSHWWLLLLLLLLLAFGVYVAYPRLKETILHKHSFSEEWVADETDHWHICEGKKCDEVKDKANHSYDNDCDTTCNVCGAERIIVAHIYDDDCDTTCNICGHTRVAPHSYGEEYKSNVFNHWKECPECHTTTPETIHIFSGDCDMACNICGYIRAGLVDHTFGTEWYSVEDGHFHKCTICEEESTPHVAHTFKNGICDVCEYAREELAFSYDSETESYTVTGIGRITDTDIVIPATYDDGTNGSHPVKSVEMLTFGENADITSVTFSENMELIDGAAFMGCTSLTSVTFSSTITKIGIGAFGYCPLLTEITLPSGLLEIGHVALSMTGLTTISIPESVTTIGYNPFLGCTDLTSISTGTNTKFHVTTGCLIDTENKKLITGLNYSTIPTNSEEVTSIGQFAFAGVSGVSTLKIPNNITTIEESIFESCVDLTSVELPSGLSIVDGYVFRSCENLTSIVIPASVTKIRENSFDDCTSLTIVYYGGANETAWNQINRIGSPDNNILDNNVTVYYYSENEPTTMGNFWHYVEGVPTIWTEKVTYKVEHYTEKLDGEFELASAETQNLAGTTGTIATATAKTLAGFTHDTDNTERRESGTITADGELTLKVYYTRNSYSLTLTKGTGIANATASGDYVTASGTGVTTGEGGTYSVKYGATVTLTATTSTGYGVGSWTGYTFTGNTFIMPAEAVTITANATANTYAISFSGNATDDTISISSTSKNVTYDSQIGELPTATRRGYDFGGWFVETSGTTKILATTILNGTNLAINHTNKTLTVYAKWTACVYGEDWESDEDEHWKVCSNCNGESTHEAHTFVDGICTTCEYARKELAFSYDGDTNSYTVTGIGRVTDTNIVIPATYDDGRPEHGSLPVKSVEESAFASLYTSNPSSITSVVFSENMETIGQGAFFGCENLTTVTLSGTIKEIGTWAFAMTGLTSINIPASVETIGDNPFTYCESLTSITVDSANTKFHVNNSCLIDTVNKKIITGLSYSNIPSNSEEVTTIGWGAFAKMSGGTTLKIPSNIVTIGDGAFSDCTSIVSVELPNEIGISNAAFDVCTSLTTIYYAGTQAEWSENVSYNSSYNTAFVNATIYYYSETEPMTTGKYWHYVDSVATPWAEKMTYKVEHYVENESGGYNTPESTENLVGIIGGEVTATPKTYAHYTHDTENDDRVESGTVTSDGNLVLKVYYYRNSYTLTLAKGTGIVSVSITGASDVATISEGKYSIKHGEAVRLIATAEAGYTFSGWTGYSSINSNNVFTMPTENVTLTANATANTNTPYTIKYYMQNIADDDFTEDTLRTVNETGTTGTTATITAEYITGFTFDSTKSSNSGTIEGDGSLVLELYYTRRVGQLFITKDTGIASVTATGDSVVKLNETDSQVGYNVRYGAEVTLSATANDGYTFSGWAVASGSTATITDNKLIQNTANVINITANATANTNTPYKVEHYQEDLAGGTYTLADTDNLTGTTGTTATATAKTDYDYFTHDTSNTNRVESGTIAGDGSLVLRVYYTRKTGTLLIGKDTGVDTVSASGTGVTVTTGTATYTRYSVKYGAEVTLSATASTGYTLAGWEKGSVILSGNTYTHNALEIMVTAKATANTYSLAYNTNGGGTIASTNKTYNTAFIGAELPTNLTKTGYAFAGWFNDSSFTTEVEIGDLFTTTNATFTNVSTASTTATIYAKWTEITYTIAFDNNGGSGEMASLTNVAYSENKTLTTNTFEKEGYTFLGWATTSTGSKVYDDGQSVSGLSATDGATITLYAVWQDNSSENSGSGGE